jgi:hypothetical protein
VSALLVECEACKSKFRLDPSLFKGAKAIRVRCRKCGGGIIVRNPGPHPASEIPATPGAATSTAADYTFESITELWKERYREARNGKSDIVDVRKTEDFVNKHEISESSFMALRNTGESYLSLVKGISPGNTCAENAVRKDLCFFPRLLKVETVNDLPPARGKITNAIIDETFFLGLASHLIISDHPHRHKINRLKKECLYLDFLEACRSADKDLRIYDKDMNGIPGDIFKEQFARHVEPLFAREFSVGFWKMGKIRSNFRNIFFGGIALGVLSDSNAEEYLADEKIQRG